MIINVTFMGTRRIGPEAVDDNTIIRDAMAEHNLYADNALVTIDGIQVDASELNMSFKEYGCGEDVFVAAIPRKANA